MNDMTSAAAEWGIASGYHDVFGHWHDAPPETLRTIIEALGAGHARPALPSGPPEPTQFFQGDERRLWGIAVQLYSVRSQANWGIGDFGDLAVIVRVAADVGAAAVGLNPLHALFLDRPQDISPYAPNSRCFLNPLYINVDAVADFSGREEFESGIAATRAGELIDYGRIASLKLKALRQCYDRFRAGGLAHKTNFEAFRREQGEALMRFSCFEVLKDQHADIAWPQWPDSWRCPSVEDLWRFRRDYDEACGFYEYLQWIADRQLYACTQLAHDLKLGVGLYLDLAVGVDPNGADAWANQGAVLSGFCIGAPPDEFNPAGQNWGLVPFNPHRLADDNFAMFRRVLRASMKYGGAVRLDHVIGLMRLYLIPSSGGGTYVRYPLEALLNVVAEESHRYRCVFIGEDLGTVPDGFRDIAACHGMWSYRVMLFERTHGGGFKPSPDYPRNAIATFNTHDLPTFKGWMTAHDLAVKNTIGMNAGESGDARNHSRQMLREALAPRDAERFSSIVAYLAATPSRLAMVCIEDLLDVSDQINVPGTTDQHPNWRRKLPLPIDEWGSYPTFADTVRVFDDAGRNAKTAS